VASYDKRFDGIYNCTLLIVSERRIRAVNFVIRVATNKFEERIDKKHYENTGKNEDNN
jgi:hypothetical protein